NLLVSTDALSIQQALDVRRDPADALQVVPAQARDRPPRLCSSGRRRTRNRGRQLLLRGLRGASNGPMLARIRTGLRERGLNRGSATRECRLGAAHQHLRLFDPILLLDPATEAECKADAAYVIPSPCGDVGEAADAERSEPLLQV